MMPFLTLTKSSKHKSLAMYKGYHILIYWANVITKGLRNTATYYHYAYAE
jgi:hypothetical protein